MSFAGVSFIAKGRLQQPSDVYSGTASGSGYHLLVVEGYSHIKNIPNETEIECRPFMLGGYRWVHFDFSFIDEVEEQAPSLIRATDACDFSSSTDSWGQSDFMERKALEQSKHLKDDCFTIRCDIIIVDPLTPFMEVPSPNMGHHFNKLLRTKVGTDVTFMVGGQKFAAHRCVLAARSAVFMAELFGPMKEGTMDSVIQIQDMEASVFKALLRFVYTDTLPKMEVPSMVVKGEVEEGRAKTMWLQHLLVAADRYDLRRLKSLCEEQLAKRIDLSSVAIVLALAAQHQCGELKEACLEFLNVQSATALKGVMATSDWERISITYPCVPNELIAKLTSKA
ncbi:unnamed protein product [Alopecurus aequalis]